MTIKTPSPRIGLRRQSTGKVALENWESLWGLLLEMTIRKCQPAAEGFTTERRDIDLESGFTPTLPSRGMNEREGNGPTAFELAMLNETIDKLKTELDPLEWDIFTLRLDEHPIPEIGQIVSRSERTVARTLQRVRKTLTESNAE